MPGPARAAFAVGLTLLAPAPALQAGKEPLAAFVTLGRAGTGEQFALGRVVIDKAGADCPALEPLDGGKVQPTTPRRNPDPARFDVTVCEAVYPTDGSRLKVHGADLHLPAVPAQVSRLVLLGDTGCKPKDQHDCKPGKHWPFGEMADAAAAATPGPQLVLHVGDYNYRGTPGKIDIRQPGGGKRKVRVYDAGDNAPGVSCKLSGPYFGQNSAGSDTPDAWKPWRQDFFEPARQLLRAAPWVFARGNHELCSRAGPGYFYLLDPGSDLVPGSGGQLACPAAEAPEPLIFREPYRLDLGALSLVVLDSANACDQGDLHQAHFDAQFRQIRRLAQDTPSDPTVWLLSHRPLWGFEKPDDTTAKGGPDASGKYAVIDKTMQTAHARAPWPRPIELVLSGHMHRFQAIGFAPLGAQPGQLVVGNGGVALAHNYPAEPFTVALGGATAAGFGISDFGYLEMALNGGGWSGRLLDRKGRPLARCGSDPGGATGICDPEGDGPTGAAGD